MRTLLLATVAFVGLTGAAMAQNNNSATIDQVNGNNNVIAHPGYVMASLGDAAARTRRRSARTGRLLALAVLTTERNAA